MATLINASYLKLLRKNNIDPNNLHPDAVGKKQANMASKAAALTTSAFSEGIEALRKATSAMTPTFLMGKKLHDQLTTILDSVSNQSDLLDYSKTQTELMKQMKKATKDANDELKNIIQSQVEALDRLNKFRNSEDRAGFNKVINRKSVGKDEAESILATARQVAADLKNVAPIAKVDSNRVVPQMNQRITDKRLGTGYRKTVARETVGFLNQASGLKDNPELKGLTDMLNSGQHVSEKQFDEMAQMFKEFEKTAFAPVAMGKEMASALAQLKGAGNRHERRSAIEGAMKQLSGVPKYMEEVERMQKAFQQDGKMNAHTSKKVALILQKMMGDTTQEKIVYNLKELNEKFDESLLNEEHVKQGMSKNNLAQRFADHPGMVSKGKGIAATGISAVLDALGLGNLDAALGISDGIVSGVGSVGEHILNKRAAKKGAAEGVRQANREATRAARGGGRLSRIAGGLGKGVRVGAALLTGGLISSGVSAAASGAEDAVGGGIAGAPGAPTPGKAPGKMGRMAGGIGKFARGGGRLLAGAAKLLGPIAMAGMAAVDGVSGWNDASNIAGLPEGQTATFGQKSQAALSSILSGLSFGIVDTKTLYAGLDKVTDSMKDASAFITTSLSKGMEAAAGYMQDLSKLTMDDVSKGWDTLKGWGDGAWKTVAGLASDTLDEVTKIGGNMVDSAKKYLGEDGIKGLIFGPAGAAIGAAIDFFNDPKRMADMIAKAKSLGSNLNPMNWFNKGSSGSSSATPTIIQNTGSAGSNGVVGPASAGGASAANSQPLDPGMAFQPTGSAPTKGQATLATRNFNPGNIRYSDANQWVGGVGQQGGFQTFDTVVHGARAWLKLARKNAASGMTLAQLVNKLSPPSENNTSAYINAVVKETGIPADTQLDPNNQAQLKAIALAVFRQEGYQGSISAGEMQDAWDGTDKTAKGAAKMQDTVNAAIKGATDPNSFKGATTSTTPAGTDPNAKVTTDPVTGKTFIGDASNKPVFDLPMESQIANTVGIMKSATPVVAANSDVGAARDALTASKVQAQTASVVANMQAAAQTTQAVKDTPPTVIQSGGGGAPANGSGSTKAAKNIDDISTMAVNNSNF